MMKARGSQFTTIALTAAAAATIFASNFISSEKIKQRVKRRYAVSDPQFGLAELE